MKSHTHTRTNLCTQTQMVGIHSQSLKHMQIHSHVCANTAGHAIRTLACRHKHTEIRTHTGLNGHMYTAHRFFLPYDLHIP